MRGEDAGLLPGVDVRVDLRVDELAGIRRFQRRSFATPQSLPGQLLKLFDPQIAEPDLGAVGLKEHVALLHLAKPWVHFELALGNPRLEIRAEHFKLEDLAAVQEMFDVVATN
jgi:hypothetical protein